MSRPSRALPVKLIMSVISPLPGLIARAAGDLSVVYGEADFVSALIPFDYTGYYAVEMGSPLSRRFLAFERLIAPEGLPDIKQHTNEVERGFEDEGKRRVNIDPGYIADAHLILATGKGYAHRPYLRDGIYADLTLMYKQKSFRPLAWTYPDYASPSALTLFQIIRGKYLLQRKGARP